MNFTSISGEITIRDLQLAVRSQGNLIDDLQRASREHWDRIQHQARQIHDLNLTLRLERLEKTESKDTLNRRLKALDEKDHVYGLTKPEAEELDWLRKRISLMMAPATVGNTYTSPEGWDAKQKAVESSGYDELEEAHKYLDTLGVKRRTDLQRKLYARHSLRGRIEILNGNKPKWRDAETDPPKVDSGRFLTWQMGIHLVAFYNRLDNPGRRWTINGNDCTTCVTHWQDLPAPPQATEKA